MQVGIATSHAAAFLETRRSMAALERASDRAGGFLDGKAAKRAEKVAETAEKVAGFAEKAAERVAKARERGDHRAARIAERLAEKLGRLAEKAAERAERAGISVAEKPPAEPAPKPVFQPVARELVSRTADNSGHGNAGSEARESVSAGRGPVARGAASPAPGISGIARGGIVSGLVAANPEVGSAGKASSTSTGQARAAEASGKDKANETAFITGPARPPAAEGAPRAAPSEALAKARAAIADRAGSPAESGAGTPVEAGATGRRVAAQVARQADIEFTHEGVRALRSYLKVVEMISADLARGTDRMNFAV